MLIKISHSQPAHTRENRFLVSAILVQILSSQQERVSKRNFPGKRIDSLGRILNIRLTSVKGSLRKGSHYIEKSNWDVIDVT